MVHGQGICHGRKPAIAQPRKTIEAERTRDTTVYLPRVGGRGYELNIRRQVILKKLNGTFNDASSRRLRHHGVWPSERTDRRYRWRFRTYGHVHRHRATGNKRSEGIVGIKLLLLSIYRTVYPKATSAEINAFLWNAHGQFQDVPRFFSPSQITRAEQRLGLSRKVGSTTNNGANTPRVKRWRFLFFCAPYPAGVADIAREDMIDIDECKILLSHANRRIGKALTFQRVRSYGHSGPGPGVLLLMAISGGLDGERWYFLEERSGTTTDWFLRFIRKILEDIGPGTPARRRCFIMDNLNVHHNALIVATIILAGHRVAFRAPYHPFDGPIEYFFNSLECALRINMESVNNLNDVQREIRKCIRKTVDFVMYFLFIGFR